MKKIIVILTALVFVGISLHAQEKRSSHEINIGYGWVYSTGGDDGALLFADWTWSSYITPRFHAGLGVKISNYHIPVYAHFKAILGEKKVKPYVAVNLGYVAIKPEDRKAGLYCQPSIGIRFPAWKNTMWNIALGVTSDITRFDSYSDWEIWDVWELRLGLVF